MASIGRWVGLAAAGGWLVAQGATGNFAEAVVDYQAGVAVGGFTNAWAALGEPSRETDDPDPVWGGLWLVEPTSSPYLTHQIVGLGAGGRLTLRMDRPVLDRAAPEHPYGIDLLVFGNAFFSFGTWPTVSGDLGGNNIGTNVVSVSDDGEHFYRLIPPEGRVAVVDALFPTDGQGDFGLPVNPELGSEAFAGLDLSGIRELYAGSGGGAGFDLAWAVDGSGNPVVLPWVRYVRFEQLNEKAEIDAVSAVSPRTIVFEDFRQPPSAGPWLGSGEVSLFRWQEADGWLAVTWDSAQPNSYWYRPLGTVLSRVDDFTLGFDLRLDSIQAGSSEGKPAAFQIALGLVQLESALRPEFYRGTGVNSIAGPRNALEFDYFPDGGFGATVSPALISADNQFAAGFEFPVELPLGEWVRVLLDYSASDATLRTRLLQGGMTVRAVAPVTLPESFTDFRLDTVAICSFSDAGQEPPYAGSVLAQGAVDNVLVVLPDPPVAQVVGDWQEGAWVVSVSTQPDWTYVLEWTVDFVRWTQKDSLTATDRGGGVLRDPAPDMGRGFYRVQAVKP